MPRVTGTAAWSSVAVSARTGAAAKVSRKVSLRPIHVLRSMSWMCTRASVVSLRGGSTMETESETPLRRREVQYFDELMRYAHQLVATRADPPVGCLQKIVLAPMEGHPPVITELLSVQRRVLHT